jgi:pimeloyl-ACP methyl ester carboxylesterase
MGRIEAPKETSHSRRHLFGVTAATFAAAKLGAIGVAIAKPLPAIKPGTNTSFASLKQTDAGLLNVGYAEAGPSDGPAVLLLHGWPYDIHSYVDVAPLLASAGYRVIVPYLRGYGSTQFLSSDTIRNGQQSLVALDIIALMDALKIEKALIGGFDWGARTANIIAALWPARCKAMVSVSGYLIGSQKANEAPLRPQAEFECGTNSTSPRNAAVPAMTNTATIFPSSSGSLPRRNGPSTMPCSAAARRLSIIQITSRSLSITIAGGSAWLRVKRNTTI